MYLTLSTKGINAKLRLNNPYYFFLFVTRKI